MKKFILLIAVMCVLLTACTNTSTDSATVGDTTPPSITTSSTTVNIDTLCAGIGTVNKLGWVPANIYMDTIQKQYDENPNDYLKSVINYSEHNQYTAKIFLGIKSSVIETVYAYEAHDRLSNNSIIMYVNVATDNTYNITTGPMSDLDKIILGIDNSKNEETNSNISE